MRRRSSRSRPPIAIACFFLVIDCRGVVRLVAPIAPDADDIDAATDEVLAGAEQAEHARTRR